MLFIEFSHQNNALIFLIFYAFMCIVFAVLVIDIICQNISRWIFWYSSIEITNLGIGSSWNFENLSFCLSLNNFLQDNPCSLKSTAVKFKRNKTKLLWRRINKTFNWCCQKWKEKLKNSWKKERPFKKEEER